MGFGVSAYSNLFINHASCYLVSLFKKIRRMFNLLVILGTTVLSDGAMIGSFVHLVT